MLSWSGRSLREVFLLTLQFKTFYLYLFSGALGTTVLNLLLETKKTRRYTQVKICFTSKESYNLTMKYIFKTNQRCHTYAKENFMRIFIKSLVENPIGVRIWLKQWKEKKGLLARILEKAHKRLPVCLVDCPTQLIHVIWICQLSRRWQPFPGVYQNVHGLTAAGKRELGTISS